MADSGYEFIGSLFEDVLKNSNKLIILIASLGDFFIPLQNFSLKPTMEREKMQNFVFIVDLLKSLGIETERFQNVNSSIILFYLFYFNYFMNSLIGHIFLEISAGDQKSILRIFQGLLQRFTGE